MQKEIKYITNDNKVCSLFSFTANPKIIVSRFDYDKNSEDIEILEITKDNNYTKVEKDKYRNNLIAVKKIKKEQLKEDIKEEKVIDEVTEEDFKEEIEKFNIELLIMKKCYCDNSV